MHSNHYACWQSRHARKSLTARLLKQLSLKDLLAANSVRLGSSGGADSFFAIGGDSELTGVCWFRMGLMPEPVVGHSIVGR